MIPFKTHSFKCQYGKPGGRTQAKSGSFFTAEF